MKNTPYPWRCLVCDTTNAATDAQCVACASPSRMSGWEIEAAQAHRAGLPPPPVHSGSLRDMGLAAKGIASELEPLPLWRQAMLILGLGGCLAGFTWFWFAFSLRDFGLALTAIGGGMLLIWLCSIGRPRPPEKPPA